MKSLLSVLKSILCLRIPAESHVLHGQLCDGIDYGREPLNELPVKVYEAYKKLYSAGTGQSSMEDTFWGSILIPVGEITNLKN